MYGVTQATLSKWRGRPATDNEIRDLTKAEGKRIYNSRYWRRVAGDSISRC